MKKFTENMNPSELSNERVESLKGELEDITTNVTNDLAKIKNIQSEIDSYRKNGEANKNDQLDDSYIKMLEIISEFEEVIAKINTISSNLDDYNNNGRQYLY